MLWLLEDTTIWFATHDALFQKAVAGILRTSLDHVAQHSLCAFPEGAMLGCILLLMRLSGSTHDIKHTVGSVLNARGKTAVILEEKA